MTPDESQPEYLIDALATRHRSATLTYAQSRDNKIAGPGGQMLPLSCPESMRMTHWMRYMHDAILVGVGTVSADDPQLNTRHLPLTSDKQRSPRPVVLDTLLVTSTGCRLLLNYRTSAGRQPLFYHSKDAPDDRREALSAAGAEMVAMPLLNGHISMHAVLDDLDQRGYHSVMIEGGAKIIASCLAAPNLLDRIIVTVSPSIVGQGIEVEDISCNGAYERSRSDLALGVDTISFYKPI
ncbi:uncharacterized protein L969DRAFT_92273 [Mixia osmundae IAM 14324]|uniref:2,5-diamino-6-ribosylamino-4(3H)-pyrimidinone 5'-phosphate reductase n=1 Tax=Mixia osmundae (strain CBS 9802 / IAM 14324 / JCM 22182 / KY 12970) TaxID=764103 RepID=G7DTG2_MIXOS|nr:uncharacterized protein L969DRAFT_92273 [Mixia osmundae IAM 14324]KEI42853.1 hypothetical protein L969DRAFT_92273 [Mixia osmundae IAM 14324]GAA93809.1 hypothetical protein E5Q_00455 [Mixia osmundae IAM 14324]